MIKIIRVTEHSYVEWAVTGRFSFFTTCTALYRFIERGVMDVHMPRTSTKVKNMRLRGFINIQQLYCSANERFLQIDDQNSILTWLRIPFELKLCSN